MLWLRSAAVRDGPCVPLQDSFPSPRQISGLWLAPAARGGLSGASFWLLSPDTPLHAGMEGGFFHISGRDVLGEKPVAG